MAVGLSITDIVGMVKERYDNDFVNRRMFEKSKLWAMLKKNEKSGGSYYNRPVKYKNSPNRSATATVALAATGNSAVSDFRIPFFEDNARAVIALKTLRTANGGDNSVMDSVEFEFDNALEQLENSLQIGLFNDGSMVRGTIGSAAAGVITLGVNEDVLNFQVGDTVVFAANATGSLRDSGNAAVITSVQRREAAGSSITVTGNVALTGSGDSIFIKGDAANGSGLLAPFGLKGWLPSTAPTTGDAFYGIDRSIAPELFGTISDGRGKRLQQAIIDGVSYGNMFGATPDVCVLNPIDFGLLVNELQDKVRYTEVKASSTTVFSFNALTLPVGNNMGEIKVVSDIRCPRANAFLLNTDLWEIQSAGPIGLEDQDGNEMLRIPGDASYEMRFYACWRLDCKAPSKNIRVINFGVPA